MAAFDLEAEVRDLAARRDIAAACRRYMRGQDRLLPDVQSTAFHADARIDCGLYAGDAAGFVGFAQGFLAGCDASRHVMGQHSIEVARDLMTAGERLRGCRGIDDPSPVGARVLGDPAKLA